MTEENIFHYSSTSPCLETQSPETLETQSLSGSVWTPLLCPCLAFIISVHLTWECLHCGFALASLSPRAQTETWNCGTKQRAAKTTGQVWHEDISWIYLSRDIISKDETHSHHIQSANSGLWSVMFQNNSLEKEKKNTQKMKEVLKNFGVVLFLGRTCKTL